MPPCCSRYLSGWIVLLQGDNVFGRVKFESGVHRVQRIPINDTKLQTSAVAVVVMPEEQEVDSSIDASDLRIDFFRSSGPGGQHANTTDSAVRITHLPTKSVVVVQDERSQHKNKAKAMKILAARVADARLEQQQHSRDELRRSQVRSGDRSERIRTYNFAQNRITDHRINKSVYGMEAMMRGEFLNEFVDKLCMEEQTSRMEEWLQNKG